MTEHTRYRFHVHAVLECQRCECVSQVMKSQMFQPCIFQDFLMDVDHRIRMVHLACFGDGNIHGLLGCFWCSATSRSTASCGIEILRMEFSVFGRVISGSPALLRPACLLTEMVLFSIRGVGVLRDFHVDGRVLKSLIIEKRRRGYAWYPLRRSLRFPYAGHILRWGSRQRSSCAHELTIFCLRRAFEKPSGTVHKAVHTAPSGRSQRRR